MIPNFTYTTLPLAPDEQGENCAMCIASNSNEPNRPSVLYIHGFIDYFFHPHVAEAFHQAGYNFYALELRKYGHALQPHQHANYCRKMDDYFEELDATIARIWDEHQHEIWLLGHSTGGLLSLYYKHKGNYSHKIKGLMLNAPFLELNRPLWARRAARPMSALLSKFLPYSAQKKAVAPLYPQCLHRDFYGEWDFNWNLKPLHGFPAYYAWLNAVFQAQRLIFKNPLQDVPVLLLHAHRSLRIKTHTPEAHRCDLVLDVARMKILGPKLGNRVTMVEIRNGMHDLFLSEKPVRELALQQTVNWLAAQ